ncbi:MAG TPA: TrmH family RNA methyltransferase [Herpetosiphonaceae bacterium]
MSVVKPVPAGIQHPRVKQYLAVKNNTKSNPENLACLEGLWELTIAQKEALEIRAFFVCPELLRGDAARALVDRLMHAGVHSYQVSERVMQRLADKDEPDGLAAIVRLPRFTWDDLQLKQHNSLVVLDALEIPGNIGTIIRCADAVGADGIIITNRRTRLSHPKLLHSSMGSSFTFPVIEAQVDEAIRWLKEHDFRIVTTDADAPLNYRKADYRGRVAVVMGSERYGIVREWHDAADVEVAIPMTGKIDSLNVGNAAVLMLYEVFHHQQPEKFANR